MIMSSEELVTSCRARRLPVRGARLQVSARGVGRRGAREVEDLVRMLVWLVSDLPSSVPWFLKPYGSPRERTRHASLILVIPFPKKY